MKINTQCSWILSHFMITICEDTIHDDWEIWRIYFLLEFTILMRRIKCLSLPLTCLMAAFSCSYIDISASTRSLSDRRVCNRVWMVWIGFPICSLLIPKLTLLKLSLRERWANWWIKGCVVFLYFYANIVRWQLN